MSRRRYVGYGRLLPADLPRMEQDLEALPPGAGVVFLDPLDGVHPLLAACRVKAARPDASLVLPLVCRDQNRTALLRDARAAEGLGAAGLLLLSGRLDAADPARPVHEVDPSQLLVLLRDAGVALEPWVWSRLSTAAQRERVEALAHLGARRCVVPWDSGGTGMTEGPLPPVLAPSDPCHAASAPRDQDLLLTVSPGGLRAALSELEEGEGRR